MNKKYIAAIAVILGVSSAFQIYGAELVHRYSFPANSVWSPDGYYILEDSVGDADGRTYGSAYCSDIYDCVLTAKGIPIRLPKDLLQRFRQILLVNMHHTLLKHG